MHKPIYVSRNLCLHPNTSECWVNTENYLKFRWRFYSKHCNISLWSVFISFIALISSIFQRNEILPFAPNLRLSILVDNKFSLLNDNSSNNSSNVETVWITAIVFVAASYNNNSKHIFCAWCDCVNKINYECGYGYTIRIVLPTLW